MKTLNKLIIIMLLSPLTMIGQMDDKTMHMIAGNVISTGVGYTMYEITDKPALSVGIGFFSGVLAGVLKEAYDKQQGRVFNNQDLAATIWGSLIGSLITIPIIDINRKNRRAADKRYELKFE